MVGQTDAEDLTQDVFVKVGLALEHFRGDAFARDLLFELADLQIKIVLYGKLYAFRQAEGFALFEHAAGDPAEVQFRLFNAFPAIGVFAAAA